MPEQPKPPGPPEGPSISPAWIAALLATVAVIGAVAVYLLAVAGHRADDLRIADYRAATEPWLAIGEEAERSLDAGEPFDAERIDEAYSAVFVLETPGILDPLHERETAWLEALVEANAILLRDGQTTAFASARDEARAAGVEAERERQETFCNADPSMCDDT